MMLSNIVPVVGILLTLIIFLFNLAWPKIKEALGMDEFIAGEKAREKIRDKITQTLIFLAVPLFIAFILLFYINLPAVIKIIIRSEFSFWYFDIQATLYIMVEGAILFFSLFNGSVIVRLIKKRSRFSKAQ